MLLLHKCSEHWHKTSMQPEVTMALIPMTSARRQTGPAKLHIATKILLI